MKIIKTEQFEKLNKLMNDAYNCMKRFEIEYAVYESNYENDEIQRIYHNLIKRYERRFESFKKNNIKLSM